MLVVPPELAGEMAEHARREAPRECCGVLIGRADGDVLHVERAFAGRNLATSHDLYELDPEDFVRADALAGQVGLEVLGFYHSHPRGPERLSQIDRERAWPGYVQLLIAPKIGSGGGFSAWWQPSEKADFVSLTLA